MKWRYAKQSQHELFDEIVETPSPITEDVALPEILVKLYFGKIGKLILLSYTRQIQHAAKTMDSAGSDQP